MASTASESPLREVLEWNHRIVLGDLLAVEAHLAVLGRENIKDSWCIKKHITHAMEHGVREAISHAEALGLDSSKYREFYKKLESLPEVPTIKQIRELRDEWRLISGDKTLTSECPICSLDVSEKVLEKIKELSSRIERKLEESSSIKLPDINLNTGGVEKYSGSAMRYKDGLIITGGQFVVEGVKEYEPSIEASVGSDVLTGIEIVGGAVVLGLGMWERVPASFGDFLMVIGGGLLAHGVIRGIKKLTAPATAVAVAPSYRVSVPAPAAPAAPSAVSGPFLV